MKLSIWAPLFAKKTAKYITAFCFLFLSNNILAQPATVIIENPNELRITKKEDGTKAGIFQISVYREPQKNADGSIELLLQIKTGFPGIIRFGTQKISKSENEQIFSVRIPAEELSNQIFYREIILVEEQEQYSLERIKLRIEPLAELSIDATEVNFGKLCFENGSVVADSQSVILKYSVLKDAVCKVTSKNNFRLMQGRNFIPYSMNNMTSNGKFILAADKGEIEAIFKIKPLRGIPPAGEYVDEITFTLQSEL